MEVIFESETSGFYRIDPGFASNSLAETLTLSFSNLVTNISIALDPAFLIQPQSESLFLGSQASFTAQAIYTTGYQWQKNGTNLTENGHYSGVTNSTLTVANVNTDDAGTYTVIAGSPDHSIGSADALLSVFKPIQLSIASTAPSGFVRVLAGNADHGPFEAERVSHIDFYFSADINRSFDNWELRSNLVLLTNGALQTDFDAKEISAGYWRVVERP